MARVFSGVQPTANVPHLGNYIGAFRHWVDLQDQHECLFCVVDLHSLTLPWDAKLLRERSRQTAASLMASGIDPARATIFLQSEVPEHTELSWILTCISRMGELSRMTQFKDKTRNQQGDAIPTGIFCYPVLMAADVLVYRGELVPVGDDQRQHLELMRNIAERFNRQFGETFPVPEPYIPREGARIMSLDDPTAKMTKSSDRPNNLIWMNDPPEVVKKKIARAVTDSGTEIRAGEDKPALTNLLTIYSAVAEPADPGDRSGVRRAGLRPVQGGTGRGADHLPDTFPGALRSDPRRRGRARPHPRRGSGAGSLAQLRDDEGRQTTHRVAARMTYSVKLDVFEGPLDLLLQLVSRERVNVAEISIAGVTEEFLRAMEKMGEVDLETASSFLVLAATLLELKSLKLLPDRSLADPDLKLLLEERDRLLHRLIVYSSFKEAAQRLLPLVQR